MQLPNPNQHQPFDRVITDVLGQPQYGIRGEHTRDEEIVHLPSNRSNQTYYQPEVVSEPGKCAHDFLLIDVGKREIECQKHGCNYATRFIAGVNTHEENGHLFVTLYAHTYRVRPA